MKLFTDHDKHSLYIVGNTPATNAGLPVGAIVGELIIFYAFVMSSYICGVYTTPSICGGQLCSRRD